MSAFGNPKIVDDGLVFMYDANNKKSYKGRPTENLWDDILNTQSLRSHTKHYWNGRKWKVNSTYSHPGVRGPKGTYLGIVLKHTSGSLNSTWSGNSYGYMLRDIACTSGSTFTQSCWVYASEGCNVDAIPSVIEGESGGETTVTGYSASYDLTNKGTWQVIAKRATSDGNTRFIPLYPRKNGVTDGSFTGFFMWALPQVVEGSNVVRPIQPGESRSATQGLLDRTGNFTIDLSNASFNNNAKMTFDGTDDRTVTSENISFGSNATWVAWVNRTSSVNSYNMFMGRYLPYFGLRSSNIIFSNNIGGTQKSIYSSGFTPANNTWYHLAFTTEYDGTNTTAKMYINGDLNNSGSFLGEQYEYSQGFAIGEGRDYASWYPFNGEVPSVGIYNRTLTATEILKNYNTTKSRFGL